MMKKALEALLISLVVVMVVGGYFKYVGGIPFSVNQVSTQKMSTFDVFGTAKKSVAPDQATVDIGVRKQGKTVKDAQSAGNAVLDQLVKELKKIGISEKDVKTTNYSVNPEYAQDNIQKITGYVVYANTEVTVKDGNFEKIEQVMDLAGSLGLEQVGGLRFGLSEELEKSVKAEVRVLAIKEAKEKGENLAKLAGMRLGKIINIVESGSEPYIPQYVRSMKVDISMPSESTQVNPGTSQVSVTVTLSFETI